MTHIHTRSGAQNVGLLSEQPVKTAEGLEVVPLKLVKAVLPDPASLAPGQQQIDLEAFVAREHILVSSGGFIGITDEGLAALGLSRRVCASTTHFAALPYLLKGSQAVATIPTHAAESIAAISGLTLLPCPLSLPRYPIELGWRTSTQIDPVVVKVREAIAATFTPG